MAHYSVKQTYGKLLEMVADAFHKRVPLFTLGIYNPYAYGCTREPRHAKVYCDFAAEFARLHQKRTAAFSEFIADVASGAYPAPDHAVPIEDAAFDAFLAGLDSR